MIGEFVAEVLAEVVTASARRLGVTVTAVRGRRYRKDIALVRWFDTYRLTEVAPELPELPAGITVDELAGILGSDEVHAVLHELLAVRLTAAPAADVEQVRTVFGLTLGAAAHGADVTALAGTLFGYYDHEITILVRRLGSARPELLRQVRDEAIGARMIATLHAIDRHVAALAAQPVALSDSGFLSRYWRHVSEHHGMLEPPDFERRKRVPVADLYVPPAIVEVGRVAPALPARELELSQFDHEIDRTVLLGDPGGGKTTAAHVLMHRHTAEPRSQVPFLVTLRDFAAENPPARSVVDHIEHRLGTFYQCTSPSGFVERLLLSGAALVIFDGLDELADAARRGEATAIVERFCAEYPLAKVLVTSRVAGYDQARLDERQFKCYRIGGFRDDQVADYVRKWFAQEDDIPPGEAEQMARAFLDESADVADLRGNPLMLAVMCILYRGEGSIPRNRAELYQQCAGLLFRKWDARRHIDCQLRAGTLAEPALRHIAYWLLTRGQTRHAATEGELIGEITAFLQDRGFDSRDHAVSAAEELLAFCRSRAWVFSAAGTTVDGQVLYAFTHRTFLEYFAAGHLAAVCDTPEDLARAIAPRIARQEWEMVTELAAQIKSTGSDRGAERIYAALLAGHNRRAVKGRSNVLQFLARCLRSIDPPPRTVRKLTRSALDHLFCGDISDETRYLPLTWLLASCLNSRNVVKGELSARIADMVASPDEPTHLNGLRLAVLVARGAVFFRDRDLAEPVNPPRVLEEFWSDFAFSNAISFSSDIVAAAPSDEGLMYACLRHGFLGVRDVLAISGPDLTPLFQIHQAILFDTWWTPYLVYQAFRIARGWKRAVTSGFPEGSEKNWNENFTTVGRFLLDHPIPPWISMSDSWWSEIIVIFKPDYSSSPQTVDLAEPAKYLGIAVSILIAAELALDHRLPQGHNPPLGAFSDLYPYILRRWEIDHNARLGNLPVPASFQNLFTEWADRKIDFVNHSDNPQPARVRQALQHSHRRQKHGQGPPRTF